MTSNDDGVHSLPAGQDDKRLTSIKNVPAEGFSCVVEPIELTSITGDWSDLLKDLADPHPVLHPDWMVTWWKHYAHKRKLRLGVYYKHGRLLGLAPLCQRRVWYAPGIPFRRLELMGQGQGEPDAVCGEYINILSRPGFETEVAENFAAALLNGTFGQWDECYFAMTEADHPMNEALSLALHRKDIPVICHQRESAPFVELPATWAAYLQSRKSKRRNWMRRTLKAFESWAGENGGYEVCRATDMTTLKSGMEILARLHAERWKQAGERGCFSSDRFTAFHHDYAAVLLAKDELDLLWLEVGGRPVAAHYSFATAGRVYFYQSGRAMDVPENVRIGSVLFILAIQGAITNGLREYDFLAGDDAYKAYFATASRPLADLRIARPTLRENVRKTTRSIAAALKVKRPNPLPETNSS